VLERRVGQHDVVVGVGNDWFLQVVEEALEQAGNHVGVVDFLETVVVASPEVG